MMTVLLVEKTWLIPSGSLVVSVVKVEEGEEKEGLDVLDTRSCCCCIRCIRRCGLLALSKWLRFELCVCESGECGSLFAS